MATITSGILCDFAQVRDGLLFVLSGGLTRIARPGMPAPLGVMLALMVQMPPDEHDQAHELVIVIKNNEGAEDVARSVTGLQVVAPGAFPGESLIVPAVVDMRGLVVPAHGSYDVRMSVDGQEGPLLTCYVVKPG